jgi:hypothetical protein
MTTNDQHVADLDDEFERLGRQAGAELRMPAPADGVSAAQQSARRRRTTTRVAAAVAAVGAAALAVVGLLAIDGTGDLPRPVDEVTLPTTVPDTVAPTNAPGTWRDIANSPLSPTRATAAVWTGAMAIVLGVLEGTDGPISAVGYDVGRDEWRALADPPAALGRSPLAGSKWTGTSVLVATRAGDVLSYDPSQDRWLTGAARPESAVLRDDSLMAVSAQGVLVRAVDGWHWYDEAEDRWTMVPSPSAATVYDTLVDLGSGRLAAVRRSAVAWSVFDASTRTWRDEMKVDGPDDPRNLGACLGVAGQLVCYTEGYGSLSGVVIDPSTGSTKPFALGNHSNSLNLDGIPWFAHAWQLLSPSTATWEELPPLAGTESFGAAVWTGSELILFGGGDGASGQLRDVTAAYRPLTPP